MGIACSSERKPKDLAADAVMKVKEFDVGGFLKEKLGGKTGDRAKQYADKAVAGFEALEKEGFCKHFGEFNIELIRPMKMAPKFSEMTRAQFRDLALGYLKCAPPSVGAKVGFVVFNVLGFWLGVAESAVEMLISSSFLSAAWNIGLAYVFAYFFFWSMVLNQKKAYMRATLISLVLYAALCVWGVVTTIVFVIQPVMYAAKGGAAFLMFINGLSLYSAKYGKNSMDLQALL